MIGSFSPILLRNFSVVQSTVYVYLSLINIILFRGFHAYILIVYGDNLNISMSYESRVMHFTKVVQDKKP